jgi:Zn-dependent peptidase ImmA (M78 family)
MNPPVITRLRDFMPLRPLRYSEALRLAELQAQRFLQHVGVSEAPVPERVIAELPKVKVNRMAPFPTSGATHWVQGQWLVVLNGSEAVTRQRFSLAHELKHILDHRFVRLIYSGFSEDERHAMVEQICDYFAGCLLMPRPWVKRAYCGGLQSLPALAKAFHVSQAAMTVRLNQIGLTPPQPRCLPAGSDWTYRMLKEFTTEATYERAAPLAA